MPPRSGSGWPSRGTPTARHWRSRPHPRTQCRALERALRRSLAPPTRFDRVSFARARFSATDDLLVALYGYGAT